MFSRARAWLIVAIMVALLAACTGVRAQPEAQAGTGPTSPVSSSTREITVVGLGRVSLVPDVAKINVGTEERASTVAEAKSRVDSQMGAIAVALTGMGIEQKDVQTSQYSIFYEQEPYQPLTHEDGTASAPRGMYRVSSMLEVTVRDVEKAGAVLDSVVAAGANQVYGVNFTVSDDQKWQTEARKKAMEDARSRAGELAGLAGVELGDVLSVSEVIGGGVVMAYAERAMGGGGGIAPGELEMTTQVQVTFAIR